MEPEGVTKTLDAVSAGDIYYNEEMISLLFSQKMNDLSEKVASITSRETDIIQLMMNDMSNEEIATQLGLSIRTVNAHKGNIMRKLGTQTTAGMIKIMMDYAPHII